MNSLVGAYVLFGMAAFLSTILILLLLSLIVVTILIETQKIIRKLKKMKIRKKAMAFSKEILFTDGRGKFFD